MSDPRITESSLGRDDRFLLTPPLAATVDGQSVWIVEMSPGSARLRAERPFSTPALTLHINELRLDLPGRLAWNRPGVGATHYALVQFVDAPPEIEAAIHLLVANKRAEKIDELRIFDRYKINPGVPASFTPNGEVELIDLSDTGARIRHTGPIRPAARGTLRFPAQYRAGDLQVAARVVWSRAQKDNEGLRYIGGLRLDGAEGEAKKVIQSLTSSGRAVLDTESLAVKLQILRTRALQRARELSTHIREKSVRTDEYLLIDHVREQLRSYPDAALQWYNRARYAVNEEIVKQQVLPTLSHRDEILAIWEYLERSIDLGIIVRFFQEQTEARSRLHWR